MEAAERIEEIEEQPLIFRTDGEVLDLVKLASYEPDEEEPTSQRPTLRAVTTSLVAMIHSEIRDICAYIEERAQEA